jgi:hypothetical protein
MCMKILLVHPSVLMYSEVYLRLEPLGLEYVAGALRSGSVSDVIAGANSSDPLEVLLAGYVLGYTRARGSAGDQAG